jgi:hypothetical protein
MWNEIYDIVEQYFFSMCTFSYSFETLSQTPVDMFVEIDRKILMEVVKVEWEYFWIRTKTFSIKFYWYVCVLLQSRRYLRKIQIPPHVQSDGNLFWVGILSPWFKSRAELNAIQRVYEARNNMLLHGPLKWQSDRDIQRRWKNFNAVGIKRSQWTKNKLAI